MIYQFGNCTFDTAREEVHRAGEVINTEPQALKVLRYLLAHRDRVVSRDELFEQCWSESYVSEASLTSCLRRVRRAIGQTRTGPTLIETLHRRGYRFVAEVVEVSETEAVVSRIEPESRTALEAHSSEPQLDLMESSQPLPAPLEPAARTERRHLTVLSCTLAESAHLPLHLDPEDHYDLMHTFRSTCLEIVSQYEGQVAQQFDDGMLVYFGYPQAHEDDAQRAVRSGLVLLETMRHGAMAAWQLPGARLAIKVGIATGIMIVTSGATTDSPPSPGVGSASALAVRLGALAAPGTVMISEATAQLVAGYFDCKALHEVGSSGAHESLVVYQVHGESALQTRLEVETAYGLTPFVGREAEVALIQERWVSVQEGMGQVVLVQGGAGMGKSRLVQVLKDQIADQLPVALECRCSPYHQNTAFHPIIDLVQRALQSESVTSPEDHLKRLETLLEHYDASRDETVPLLASLLSLPLLDGHYAPLNFTPQRQREHTLETLLSLVLAQASASPLLFVVEDVHWADPTTLEFLQLLADQVSTSALLMVLTCRSGFETTLSQRTELTSVVLNRLTQTQTEEMIVQVGAGKRLPLEVIQQLVEKTDGVPLFVEELTRMVLESGQLMERDGYFEISGGMAELTIPVTLHDSLMARLDRLDTAKDIAQWGSVLGREFSYEVLDTVTPYDAVMLQEGLAQLVEAELLYQRGLFPRARYRFKHVLIQDAAYNSLVKRHRQAMHQQVAQVLETQFAEMVETQPEWLAHHYTEAGLYDPAITYWKRAGERAHQRSAGQEAVRHLTRALELLAALPEPSVHDQQELELLIVLGPALMAIKGQADVEVERVYARARALCETLGETSQRFPARWGMWRFYLNRARLAEAREIAAQLFALAQHQTDTGLLMQAHNALGTTLTYLGEFAVARDHMERALEMYDRSQHGSLAEVYAGLDPGVYSLCHASKLFWSLGYPDRARDQAHDAVSLARTLSKPHGLAFALNFAAVLHQSRREAEQVQRIADEQIAISAEHGFALWLANGNILRGWALCEQGQAISGIEQVQKGLAAHRRTGAELALPSWHLLLAQVYQRQGDYAAALNVLREVLVMIERTGERQREGECYRLQGDMLLQQSMAHASRAAASFRHALDISRRQQARALELRAATSLARLWQQEDKRREAKALLAPVYAWFTEGLDTLDLQEAKSVWEQLES